MTMQTNIPRKPNTGVPKFESDPVNSTYRWEIYLTAGRAGNKVAMLDGYSKGMGFENTNKVELLYKKLINPIMPYLYKSEVIIIYENTKALPKHLHKKIIELYPHDFAAFEWVKSESPITDYLKMYYAEFVKNGLIPDVEDRRKNVRQSVYMSELDHSKYTFNSLQELKDFCLTKSAKYSKQCMVGWYYRHADFQPELFEADSTAEKVQYENTVSAKSAVNALRSQSNFKSNR